MKKFIKIVIAGLTIIYNVPLFTMESNPLVQASELSQVEQKQCSLCHCRNFLKSTITGALVGSAIIGSAIHIGKKIETISEPISNIDIDALNGALISLKSANVTLFNEAMKTIGLTNTTSLNGALDTISNVEADTINKAAHYIIIAGKVFELVKDCPAALPHLRGIWQDCFAENRLQSTPSKPLSTLTIEL